MRHAFNALALLLMTASAACFAQVATEARDAVPHAPGLRQQMRDFRFEQQAMAQRERQIPQSDPQQSRDVADPAPQVPPPVASDGPRSGRMTPEERRALRREIGEAGHQIYSSTH